MTARYALYYAPPPDHPMWRKASAWLGRDAASGAEMTRPELEGLDGLDLDALTEDPRRYGFHATLTSPFELATDATEADLVDAAHAFAKAQAPFEADLAPAGLGSFLAFRPQRPNEDIQRLHEACVRAFHPFRAPLSEFDLARRRRASLTPDQDELLVQWGYPYVFAEYRFHMTLTGRIPDAAERARVLGALQLYFADVSGPHRFDAVCVFRQERRDAPFTILARAPFGG